MAARRALLEGELSNFSIDLSKVPARAARRALIDETVLEVCGTKATRAIDSAISPSERTSIDNLRLTFDKKAAPRNLRGRKSMLATVATMAAAAVFIVPGALSISNATEAPAPVVERQDNQVSRDFQRAALAAPVAQNAVDSDEAIQVRAAAGLVKKAEADAKAAAEAEEARKAAEAAEVEAEAAAAAAREAEVQNNAANANATAAAIPNYVTPEASGAAGAALAYALAQIGKPYSWGSAGPNAFDCSGLMVAAYGAAGISLPRTSGAMMSVGSPVSRADLQPGDLVVTYGGGHVAMYIGNGQVVNALNYSAGVTISNVDMGGIVAMRRVG